MLNDNNFEEVYEKLEQTVDEMCWNEKKERYVITEFELRLILEMAYMYGHLQGAINTTRKEKAKVISIKGDE